VRRPEVVPDRHIEEQGHTSNSGQHHRVAGASRVVIFASTLGSGGTERTATVVAGWLQNAGHSVSMLTLSDKSTDFYKSPEGVIRRGLALYRDSRGVFSALTANVRRLSAIRRHVHEFGADVFISLGDRTNILGLLAVIGLGCKTIISERTDPDRSSLPWQWRLLRRISYRYADIHVAQSNYAAKCIDDKFNGLPSVIIPNSVPSLSRRLNRGPANSDSQPRFRALSVGRLSPEKGFDVLLASFKRVCEGNRHAQLTIVGSGPAETDLKALAEQLDLSHHVDFAGEVADVSSYYEAADVFILASRREGFPNVILEAMSFGVPVIATECPGGLQDLIVNGSSGLLVPINDAARLGDAIVAILRDAGLADRLRETALSTLSRYDSTAIAKQWIATINQVLEQ
jgi:GalNAc-alpha-(1->4)-GalNAc-alpha-(1->3)-diNAcBac-PP-undecaprenol alpha-1,4-N-acetyl-D-galactosaminyltransferase